jgi:hypothetical protein
MSGIIKLKTLEQIQQENRRFILEATLQGNNLRLLKENIKDFSGTKLNLARLLLAFSSVDKEIKIELWNSSIIVKYYFFGEYEFDFDLTEETLEEQTIQTQREINELLTTKN